MELFPAKSLLLFIKSERPAATAKVGMEASDEAVQQNQTEARWFIWRASSKDRLSNRFSVILENSKDLEPQ